MLHIELTVNAIPKHYRIILFKKANTEPDRYFTMPRGYQKTHGILVFKDFKTV